MSRNIRRSDPLLLILNWKWTTESNSDNCGRWWIIPGTLPPILTNGDTIYRGLVWRRSSADNDVDVYHQKELFKLTDGEEKKSDLFIVGS